MKNHNALPEIKSIVINLDTLHNIINPYNQQLDGYLKTIENLFKDDKFLIVEQILKDKPRVEIAEFQNYEAFITWINSEFNMNI